MKSGYRTWLTSQGYDEKTISTKLAQLARVEEHYGPLDALYGRDGLDGLIETLNYSVEDERQGRPNPSKIPFIGNARNNLASYKSAVTWYGRFLGDIIKNGEPVARPQQAEQVASAARVAGRKRSPVEPRQGAKTLADFGLDGRTALEAIIASSQYGTIAQAVASLTLFSHPGTVRQTQGRALFSAIRNPKRVGEIAEHDGRQVLLDDNKSPTDAFLWANGLSRRGPDTQFNHIYTASLDVDAYTALPNICMTPAFIAKLTDTSRDVRHLLQYRSYQLYGWLPIGHEPPERPPEYEVLEWAAPLPAIENVRASMERAMATKPKDRTVVAAQTLGWLFDPKSSDQ